jgi:hypothetical protein
MNPSASQLLSIYKFKKDCIMFSRDSIKVNEDIKKVKFRNNFVPEVVIDYLLLLLMMEFEDVYAISIFVATLWYWSTCKEHRSICSELRNTGIGGGNDFEANFQYDLSEFDVCEEEADKPCKKFIFSFFYILFYARASL